MKKYISIIILVFSLLCASCRHRETYKFLYGQDTISSISIVNISFPEGWKKTKEIIHTEISTIDNFPLFLKDFHNVDCYTYFGDPTGVTEEGISAIVIRIIYNNGDYELINYCGQAEYTNTNGLNFYAGFSVFDKDQFDQLIDKYT